MKICYKCSWIGNKHKVSRLHEQASVSSISLPIESTKPNFPLKWSDKTFYQTELFLNSTQTELFLNSTHPNLGLVVFYFGKKLFLKF